MKRPFHLPLVALAALLLLPTAEPLCDLGSIRQGLSAENAVAVLRMPFQSPQLVDPRSVFPDISGYPPAELAALFRYSRGCAEQDLQGVRHPTLKKARDWHRFMCNVETDLPPDFFDTQPRFHPGGSSFVALAAESGRARFGPEWLHGRAGRLHVLESELLLESGQALNVERRILHRLAPQSLRRLVDREPLVIGDDLVFLLTADHGPLDPGVYHVYPRDRYEALLRAGQDEPARGLVWFALAASTVLLGIALVQAFRRIRLRRLLMHERARVLRTLAHEVRTPTTSLKLVLEQMRSDYDGLPPEAQKGFLALCDEVNRLERVIRESGRYLGAFHEDPSRAHRRLRIESVNAFVAGVLEPYRDRLTFEPLPADPGVVTDPYWFAVCIRNLVDNAMTHGAPPVVVRLHTDRRRLHFTVTDGGTARARELQRGLRPFLRTHSSPGFGLGLAIVADTVAGLRGRLTWGTRPTRFTMSLKRSA